MQIIQILLYILSGMIALGTVVVYFVALTLNNGDRRRVSTFLIHAIVALIGTLAVLITMLVLIYHFKLI